MILLLLKVTLLFTATLIAVEAMRRSTAAMRHLICVCALAGALLLVFTLIVPSSTPVFRINAVSVPSAARIARTAPGYLAPLLRALPWIWLAGVVVLLGRMAIGYLSVARLTRGAGKGDVVFSDVSVPFVVGLTRPVILLPRSADEWPADRMDAALRHERAHVRRKDLWTLLLSHIACAVYWFHPMVWMVADRLRREQEQACDDAVILSGFEPASYAEALMAAAQTLTSTRMIGCPMLTQNTFRSRIARLLADGMPRVSSSSTLRRAAVVFAGAVITIGLLNGAPQSPDQSGVYKVGGGVSAPRVMFREGSGVHAGSQRGQSGGHCSCSGHGWHVDGLAHDINGIKSLGSGLDEKAVEAVQKWKFAPGPKDGEAVPVRASIEINFKLL